MRKLLLAGTAAILGAVPGIALAQDQSAQAPASPGGSTPSQEVAGTRSSSDAGPTSQTQASSGLADIIVTAQRKSESAQRAAIAINVVGGADLAGAGVTQSNLLNQLVPALTIESVGPSNVTFIRGVGNFSVSVTSDPAVAYNYDGVYLGRPTSSSGTFFDLDRIEVLKGPQGTLYGRNATAGAINILPTQPKLGRFSGYATVSYGDYSALVAEGAVNVPLGPDGALRLSGTVTHRDGYLSDGSSDDKTQAFRFQLKSRLTPALTLRLALDYSRNGGMGGGLTFIDTYAYNAALGRYVVTPTNIPRSDGTGSPNSQAFYTSLPTSTAKRNRDPFPRLRQNDKFYGTNAEIEYDTGAGVLTIIPAVRSDQLSNVNPGGGFPITNLQKDIQYSVEARFAGKIGLFDYTVGGYYFNENVDLKNSTVIGGSVSNVNFDTRQNTQSFAPFGRLTANLTDRLRLVGGVRYSHDARQYNAANATFAVVCVAAACPTAPLPIAVLVPGGFPFPVPAVSGGTVPTGQPGSIVTRSDISFNSRLKFGKVTYRGAAEFDLLPASLLYASIETGFRSGGFSNAVGFETYQPENITAYTVGAKNRFFDNRVQLNVEGFYWRYRNQQVAHAGVDLAGRSGNFTQNIGRSLIKGVEVEGRVLVTPTTALSADIQYLDAKNKVFTYQVARGVAPPYTNCAVSPTTQTANGVALLNVNCAGLPGYNSPKWTFNLGAEQTVPLGDYKVVLGVNTQHKTRYYTYFDYQPEQIQPGFWQTNGQISFGSADDRWSISGYIRNIEDHRLLVAPVAVFGALIAYTSPPRTYGVRGSVKF